MANPSVTYTFTNATTADGTQVSQNFTDLINGMTDGTKSFSIDALTVAGTALFNGAVTLGNATGDDVTITGYIAADILPKTTATSDLGASGRTWAEAHLTKILTTTIDSMSTAGVAIKGATDGSSATAGYVGYKIAATLTNQTLDGTEGFLNDAVIALTPGRWKIVYSVTVGIVCGATGGNYSEAYIFIANDAGTKIGSSARSILAPITTTATGHIKGTLHAEEFVSISTNTNYKLRGRTYNHAGTGAGTMIVSTSPFGIDSTFFAVQQP